MTGATESGRKASSASRMLRASAARLAGVLACALAAAVAATPAVASHAGGHHRHPHHHNHSRAHGAGRRHGHGHTVRVDDSARLSRRKAYGSVLIEEGHASGTLPGRTWVRLTVGSKVRASFTIHTRGGSIAGTGVATPKSSGRWVSFGGTLSVSHGSGRYRHAHGKGSLYGVIDRHTHKVTVKTAGILHY